MFLFYRKRLYLFLQAMNDVKTCAPLSEDDVRRCAEVIEHHLMTMHSQEHGLKHCIVEPGRTVIRGLQIPLLAGGDLYRITEGMKSSIGGIEFGTPVRYHFTYHDSYDKRITLITPTSEHGGQA